MDAQLNVILNQAVNAVVDKNTVQFVWSTPKQQDHGHFATNAALACAKVAKASPMQLAEEICEQLNANKGLKASAAHPGFINLHLQDSWFIQTVQSIVQDGGTMPKKTNGQKIHLEFVSANPTGPVHIGGARGAAYGSTLANLLRFCGNNVFCEYYVNDHGNQIDMLLQSVVARSENKAVPEDGYQGEYLVDVAQSAKQQFGDLATVDKAELKGFVVETMLKQVEQSLTAFGAEFDNFFFESSLYPQKVKAAVASLEQKGYTHTKDDALWLNTFQLGDAKDRVIKRSNGEYTYFASDIAYHLDKKQRGFHKLVNVLGADHHGYLARVSAAYTMLGGDKEQLQTKIMQLVSLIKDGEEYKQSKRKGDFMTVGDLVDLIGLDAARWYLLSRSQNSTIVIDVDQAASPLQNNPVHYVRYAHARCCSIYKKSLHYPKGDTGEALELNKTEHNLVLKLCEWPEVAQNACDKLEPHHLTVYATSLAQNLAQFYAESFVLHSTVNQATRENRLALVKATQTTLQTVLGILGISAPEHMPSKEQVAE